MADAGESRTRYYYLLGSFLLGFFLADLALQQDVPTEQSAPRPIGEVGHDEILLHAALDQSGLALPFKVEQIPDAANGVCLAVPEGAGDPPAVLGQAQIPFEVRKPGLYRLWFRVKWNDDLENGRACSNSFNVRLNGGAPAVLGEDGTYGHWHWVALRKARELTAGEHTLIVENREDGARLDQVLIIPEGAEEKALVPRGLMAMDGNAVKVLSAKEIQRYRTDAAPLQENDKIVWEEHEDPVVFSDDFMRKEGEFGTWNPVCGHWEIYSVRQRTKSGDLKSKGTPEQLSANAFVMLGRGGPERALIRTGYDFWECYQARAAVKVSKGSSGGLAVYIQENQKGWWQVVLGGEGLGRGELSLSRMEGDQLIEAGRVPVTFWNDQWYDLKVSILAEEVQVSLDGVAVITSHANKFPGGCMGLLAEKGEVFFDDVKAEGLRTLVEDFSSHDRLSLWKSIGGKWTLAPHEASNDVLEAIKKARILSQPLPYPEILKLVSLPGQSGYCVTGNSNWRDYEFSVDVVPSDGGGWGVVWGFQDPENTYLFRSRIISASPEDYRKAELIKRTAGRDSVLFEARGDLESGKSVQIGARMVRGVLEVLRDGKQVASLADDALSSGRVGFWADGQSALFFDNFRLAPVPAHPVLFAEHGVFSKEDTMKDWARKSTQWTVSEDKKTMLHRRSFRGEQAIYFKIAQPQTGFGVDVALHARADAVDQAYRARVERVDQGLKCVLRDGDEVLGEVLMEKNTFAEPVAFVFEEVGSFLRLGTGERSLLVKSRKMKRDGDRIAVRLDRPEDFGVKKSFDPDGVDIAATQVRDYSFDDAPVDWAIGQGEWEIINRWRCQPQWSWMGGESSSVASLWSKKRFIGDTTIDVYNSFQMNQGRPMYRIRDLNLSFCAKDWDLWSGYTFLYGGYGNQKNALFRKGVLVAETTADLLPPSHDQLHRRWFYFRVATEGKRIRIFLDDKLLLEYEDPEPLKGGQTALWTNQNGMMLARVRVSYTQMQPVLESGIPTRVAAAATGTTLEAALSDCKSWGTDFEGPRMPWTVADESSVNLHLAAEDVGRTLRATNMKSGGNWIIVVAEKAPDVAKVAEAEQGSGALPSMPDLTQLPILSFDYKWSPGVRLDLYFKMGSKFYRVGASGSRASQSDVVDLGGIPEFKADGEWHSARFWLLEALSRYLPIDKPLIPDRIFWGVQVNEDYLLSGRGGNSTGSRACFDNFFLTGYGMDTTRLQWASTEGGRVESISYGIGTSSAVAPPLEHKCSADEAQAHVLEGAGDGLKYVHLQHKDKGGHGPCRVLPVLIDKTPPKVEARGATWDGTPLELVIHEDGSGLDLQKAVLQVGERQYKVGPSGFEFAAERRILLVDPALLGIAPAKGEISFALSNIQDLAGNKAPDKMAFRFAYDQARDTIATEFPSPSLGAQAHIFHDFEQDPGDFWQSLNANTTIVRQADAATDWPGGKAIRIGVNENDAPLTVRILGAPFNAGRIPLMSFDYRMEGKLALWLELITSAGQVRFRFPEPAAKSVLKRNPGKLANTNAAEGNAGVASEWQRAYFDLGTWLAEQFPDHMDLTVRSIVLIDDRSCSHEPYAALWIDNFGLFAPAGSGNAPLLDPVSVDPAGWTQAVIAVQLAKEAQSPLAFLAFKGRGPYALPALKEDGLHWVYARFTDGAGNETQTHQIPLLKDSTAPVLDMVFPQPGSSVAADHIEWKVTDSGPAILDAERLRISINGSEFNSACPAVRIDRKSGKLTFQGFRLRPHYVYPDKAQIRVSLTVADGAGNEFRKDFPAWTMDYSVDKVAPIILGAEVPAFMPLHRHTFEQGADGWAQGRSTRIAHVEGQAATGQHFLEVKSSEGKSLSVVGMKTEYRLDKAPWVSFHYKITPDVKVGLYVVSNVGKHLIRFTDSVADLTRIGELQIAADNQWHQVCFNLKEMLGKKEVPKDMVIREWGFESRGPDSVEKNARFALDNFTISTSDPINPVLDFGVEEFCTGVSTLGVVFDSSPATTEIPMKPWNGKPLNLDVPRPFKGYIHIRVADGAGNLSKIFHEVLELPTGK